jgi:hypothetical protein
LRRGLHGHVGHFDRPDRAPDAHQLLGPRDFLVTEQLGDVRQRIARSLPELRFRMTVFGSRARGDAEADSDMDVLLEV